MNKRIAYRDTLTGLLTPCGEKNLTYGKAILGEAYVDWRDMHSAHYRYSDEEINDEIGRIGRFLILIFRDKPVFVTYITGDNFRICSTNIGTSEILNILHDNKESYKGIAELVCGPGFINQMSRDIYEYFSSIPHPYIQIQKPHRTNVCTLDLRHLLATTKSFGVPITEQEIELLKDSLKSFFYDGVIWRPRSDEIWIAKDISYTKFMDEMYKFKEKYRGPLEFDFGVGEDIVQAHRDLKRKKEKTGPREKRGEFVLAPLG